MNMANPSPLQFEEPAYLWLLILLPLMILMSWRALSAIDPGRRYVTLALRAVVLGCIIVAMAGPQRVRRVDDQTVVFVLDHSRSVPREQQQEAFNFIRQAVKGMRPGQDRVALVGFDGVANIEQLAQPQLQVEVLGTPTHPDQSNLADALRYASAIIPSDTARRVVVLSDGNETAGLALPEAERLAAQHIPVDVVPLDYHYAREVIFEKLLAPGTAALNESIELNLFIRALQPTRGRILIYRNGTLLDDGVRVELEVGPNRFTKTIALKQPGLQHFEAVFQPDHPEQDSLAENNSGVAVTLVADVPRVLLLSQEDSYSQACVELLRRTLGLEKIETEARVAGDRPLELLDLLNYSAVVLSDVPADHLSTQDQQGLAAYVQEMGGGLLAIGGENSFSVGGYYDTPLEEILPVETGRDKIRQARLALVLIIDRSGSMNGEKIQWAKRAAAASGQLLAAQDQIGVIVFDSFAEWVVPLATCPDKAAVIQRIHQLGSGGGTDLYPAMQQAADALLPSTAEAKQVLILTDGQSSPGEFEKLAQSMAAANITISTVAIGGDADKKLLQQIARLANGRFYAVENGRSVPRIFIREMLMVSRRGISDKPFVPTLAALLPDGPLTGFAQPDFPPLEGYVITTAKPEATVALFNAAEENDPVLAFWRVGLGKSAAFTSGMWSTWGRHWAEWSAFSRFWTQLCRWTAKPTEANDLTITTIHDGDRMRVNIAALDEQGDAIRHLQLQGQVLDPQFRPRPLLLQHTGVGRYEGSFDTNATGNYIVRVSYAGFNGRKTITGIQHAGVAIAYSPELRALRSNDAMLLEMARITGGRLLNSAYPDLVFESASIRPIETRQPFWEQLVQWAMFLFLLDVAVRRLAVTPADLLAGGRKLLQDFTYHHAPASAPATLASLKQVQYRQQQKSQTREQLPTIEGVPSPPRHRDRPLVEPDPAVTTPSNSPTESSGQYTARLLDAKRRAHRDDESP
ncbi:MAG: hypothetical protein HJJLKODD_00136 [Phycisphaerae bacterium]|nr:hypothetical protein [Phycisphaerae bacterium]